MHCIKNHLLTGIGVLTSSWNGDISFNLKELG